MGGPAIAGSPIFCDTGIQTLLKSPSRRCYIKHFQYGTGVVTESDAERTSIDFDLHGMKKFVTCDYRKLRPHLDRLHLGDADEVFGSHWDFRANLLPLRFAESRLASAR
jgi:hypothetical protein